MSLLHYINTEMLLEKNKTHILLPLPLLVAQNSSSLGKKGDEYDADGAVLFIITTVFIYSLAIVAFVAGHIFERSKTSTSENQISEYISTFNMEHLDNLSKMYKLRSMQRKLLARYDVVHQTLTRNATVRQKSCRRHRRSVESEEKFPRIFRDVDLKRSISMEEVSFSSNQSRVTNTEPFLNKVSPSESMDSIHGALIQQQSDQGMSYSIGDSDLKGNLHLDNLEDMCIDQSSVSSTNVCQAYEQNQAENNSHVDLFQPDNESVEIDSGNAIISIDQSNNGIQDNLISESLPEKNSIYIKGPNNGIQQENTSDITYKSYTATYTHENNSIYVKGPNIGIQQENSIVNIEKSYTGTNTQENNNDDVNQSNDVIQPVIDNVSVDQLKDGIQSENSCICVNQSNDRLQSENKFKSVDKLIDASELSENNNCNLNQSNDSVQSE